MATEPIKIWWSDRLELLAAEFFALWKEEIPDPFQKSCVVVHDAATREWLKNFYLLKIRGKKILMDLEFVMLPEFLNDFLGAQVRKISPRQRHPAAHPYSRGVLPWRIYHILEKEENSPDFQELAAYVGGDQATRSRRRFALAKKTADLFDDYLNNRFRMLRAWETGKGDAAGNGWQAKLYGKLIAEDPASYAREYETFFRESGDLSAAFRCGFPAYSHVHIFDIPFLPKASLEMLIAISSVLPMTFWTFNPGDDWLADTSSKKEEIHRRAQALERLRALREPFHRHWAASPDAPEPPQEALPEPDPDESPRERLLGALASGARPLLCTQICHPALSVSPSDILEHGDLPPAMKFRKVEISLHCASSPRRELEAARDGIHDYLKRHPEKGPGDVRILCGDWAQYAPVAEAVFSPDRTADGYLPVTFASPLPGGSFIARTFFSLLEFRSNRFEATAVAQLFSCDALRRKFSLPEKSTDQLCDLIRDANIRWGADDAMINEALAEERPENVPHTCWPFSWQRGLDRLALGMLCGDEADTDLPLRTGALGEMEPCDRIAGVRSEMLVSLWNVERALCALRRQLTAHSRAPLSFWREFLMEMLDTFFDPAEEEEQDLSALRRTMLEVMESMQSAGEFAQSVEAEILFPALQAAAENQGRRKFSPESSLLFAPLNTASALPAGAVWICGINEGAFPKIDRPVSFDLRAAHPVITDVTTREKDAYALLKAALGAKDFLAFSCFQEEREKDKPPVFTVLLEDLADYFTAQKIPFTRYDHPCNAASSAYFSAKSDLPRSYSAACQKAAEILAGCRTLPAAQGGSFTAFSLPPAGKADIEVSDLADFFAAPNHFLVKKRLGLHDPFLQALSNDPACEVSPDKSLRLQFLTLPPDDLSLPRMALHMMETGQAPDRESAQEALKSLSDSLTGNWMIRPLASPESAEFPNPPKENIREAFDRFSREKRKKDAIVDLPAARLRLSVETVPLDPGLPERTSLRFFLSKDPAIYDSDKIRQWIIHLAAHAAGERLFTLMLCTKDGVVSAYPPLPQKEAEQQLERLVQAALQPLPPEFPDWDAVISYKQDQPYQNEKWFGLAPKSTPLIPTIKVGNKRQNGKKL